MVRKKEPRKPVVARPLNDISKQNLVTNFVTNKITNIDTESVNKNFAENHIKNDNKSVTQDTTNLGIEKAMENNKENHIKADIENGTKSVTTDVTKDVTQNVTEKVTKNVTKSSPKKVAIIKSISIGKKEIIAKFESFNKVRPNYNLSEDTIKKIERISDILGYKKAEFLDIYLNGTLEKILKKLEKDIK